ncbi:MAG: Na/Pi cotransporter family protein [Clostridia bacterium]|nr:Na/Pi cotransporter family protein [Clostridia bacterium]
MGIFDVLNLICGLALFLFGMEVLGNALKKTAGRQLKTILGNLTSNKLKGFLLGLGVTGVIQSSSATTVMVVGFVNSGSMTLGQAVGVIMGANVGTAVTSWITALSGIDSAGTTVGLLQWLKPDAWMPILALIGICLLMFAKNGRKQDIGTILLGFAVLMVGMDVMSGAVSGLKSSESFQSILVMFENPILGVLVGTVVTAIVQSSSASVGILQSLTMTGAISYGSAIPIILGQNIGTCATALLSSISAGKNGKRAAFVHLYFNIICVVLVLSAFYLLNFIFKFAIVNSIINPWGVAAVHTVFKLISVAIMAPATKLLEKLACLTVRGSDDDKDRFTHMLDERLLDTPGVALARARAVTAEMATLSVASLKDALALFDGYDEKKTEDIRKAEDTVDIYEDVLGSYLVKLSSQDMTPQDSHEVTKLLHMIGDFERISDHAVNLLESVEELREKKLDFSEEAKRELSVLYSAISEIVTITTDSFVSSDLSLAARVEPLEQVVDYLKDFIRHSHIKRLQESKCTIEHGFVLSDVLTSLERVSDHCSNIAGCYIKLSLHDDLSVHEYLNKIKTGGEEFHRMYGEYMQKYAI